MTKYEVVESLVVVEPELEWVVEIIRHDVVIVDEDLTLL